MNFKVIYEKIGKWLRTASLVALRKGRAVGHRHPALNEGCRAMGLRIRRNCIGASNTIIACSVQMHGLPDLRLPGWTCHRVNKSSTVFTSCTWSVKVGLSIRAQGFDFRVWRTNV